MDPYIGEIRLFAGNFAPQDWAFCLGQTLSVQQYQALYTIIGTRFGGTPNQTFKLPNLQGCALIHQGQGPGLTDRVYTSTGGTTTERLSVAQIASHTHVPNGVTSNSTTSPANAIWGGGVGATSTNRGTPIYATEANVAMSGMAIGPAGGNAAHNNMQPYVAINYIIALYGIYPIHQS